MRGQRVGYIRVSTVEQNNQRQKELLSTSGSIDRFFEDKISGRTKTARPGLRECMAMYATVTSSSSRRLIASPAR
nr:recombinase family protein [Corynebacterium aurimucosum]